MGKFGDSKCELRPQLKKLLVLFNLIDSLELDKVFDRTLNSSYFFRFFLKAAAVVLPLNERRFIFTTLEFCTTNHGNIWR